MERRYSDEEIKALRESIRLVGPVNDAQDLAPFLCAEEERVAAHEKPLSKGNSGPKSIKDRAWLKIYGNENGTCLEDTVELSMDLVRITRLKAWVQDFSAKKSIILWRLIVLLVALGIGMVLGKLW